MNKKQNILLLGSGGREHALAWKISQSSKLNELHCIPGNQGISNYAICHNLSLTDPNVMLEFINQHNIQIVVCGPEAPLADGLMDFLEQELSNSEILIGPKKLGATLESSKKFSKEFMQRHNIPTAAYQAFTLDKINEAFTFINSMNTPIVLKADGLAAGKGVLICQSHMEAKAELELMLKGKFGEASNEVVIEEFLSGIEFSSFVLTDGKNYVELPDAKDYKRIGEKDSGLNTGGMGSVSPVPFIDAKLKDKVIRKIVTPTIDGLQKDNIPYQGFIFFGLINVDGEPFVIEYNCRLGDPETESIMLRIKTDIIELFLACGTGKMNEIKMEISNDYAVTIFLVSGGYPGDFSKEHNISLPDISNLSSYIFHAGTKIKNKTLVTNGGRVIAVSSLGSSIDDAKQKSLNISELIQYEGKYYRKDIGFDL